MFWSSERAILVMLMCLFLFQGSPVDSFFIEIIDRISIVKLTITWSADSIHYVNEFPEILRQIVNRPPFDGNQAALARYAGLDPGYLSRVLLKDDDSGKNKDKKSRKKEEAAAAKRRRDATPQMVGRLCGTLSAEDAGQLLAAFLSDIVDAIAEAEVPPEAEGKWHAPLGRVSISLSCEPRRKAG